MRSILFSAAFCLSISLLSKAEAYVPHPESSSFSAAGESLADPVQHRENALEFATAEPAGIARVELASSSRVTYTVAPGDTLGKIAKQYGVSISSIRRSNRIKGDQIYVGQKLRIRSRSAAGSQERVVHNVRAGETGGKIAQRYRVSVSQLRQWNPSANIERLSIGQKLVVYTVLGDGAASSSSGPRAGGGPASGRLMGGVKLDTASGLAVRNGDRSYGMPFVIDAIKMAYGRMNAHFAEETAVLVGDLSLRNGGRMRPHKSHQNGLDADIAYLTTDCINTACAMRSVRAEDVDVPRQWYVFEDWLRQDVVEFIFVPYALQERFYEYAKARGASSQELTEWFQYPRGKNSRTGILRNWSGHDNHYHVRFRNKG